MSVGTLPERLRDMDKPLLQQGRFTDVRAALREAADALDAKENEVMRLRVALGDVVRIGASQQLGTLYTDTVTGWEVALDDAVDVARTALRAEATQ